MRRFLTRHWRRYEPGVGAGENRWSVEQRKHPQQGVSERERAKWDGPPSLTIVATALSGNCLGREMNTPRPVATDTYPFAVSPLSITQSVPKHGDGLRNLNV